MIDHKQWYLDNKPKYELFLNRVIGLSDILHRKNRPADPNSTFLEAARVYDDGSIKTKYHAEAISEDEGIRPP
ncbi:MAG: hypothetical protein M3P08_13730 [Thermoproteota archaeon]|nr:hypothetical protein [Thermoproteota archaeon]